MPNALNTLVQEATRSGIIGHHSRVDLHLWQAGHHVFVLTIFGSHKGGETIWARCDHVGPELLGQAPHYIEMAISGSPAQCQGQDSEAQPSLLAGLASTVGPELLSERKARTTSR